MEFRFINYRYNIIFIFIFSTLVSIFFDIAYIRQIFGFVCFTILPGVLILDLFNIYIKDPWKKLAISLGLSISFLLLFGLLLITLSTYIGYSKPLAPIPLSLSFGSIISIVCFILWFKYKNNSTYALLEVYSYSKIIDRLKPHFNSYTILPLLFPLLSILGLSILTETGKNYILFIFFLIIGAYIFILPFLKNSSAINIFPLSILMIASSIQLMQGLATNYVTPGDFYSEYEGYKVTALNYNWSMSYFYDQMVACLSTSLLPTIFYSLLGVNKLFIPKLVYPLICSFIPLVCYLIYRNYLNPSLSLLSSFFFMAQMIYIYSFKEQTRFMICLLFFSLYILLILDKEIILWKKRIILIVFAFSMVISYYSTPILFLYLLIWLFAACKLFSNNKLKDTVNSYMIVLFGIFIFLWWGILTYPKFNAYVYVLEKTMNNLVNLFESDMHHETVRYMITLSDICLPDLINLILHYMAFFAIFICIASIFIYIFINRRLSIYTPFDAIFAILMMSMFVLAFAFLVLPYISVAYGTLRLYQTTLIILSPAAIMGMAIFGSIASSFFKKSAIQIHRLWLVSNKAKLFIALFILIQFLSVSGMIHQFAGIPFSEYLNKDGVRYNTLWVYDSDVRAANKLYEITDREFKVATDWGSPPAYIFGFVTDGQTNRVHWTYQVFADNRTTQNNTYIFLRKSNIMSGQIYSNGLNGDLLNLEKFNYILENKNKLYAGGPQIFI